MAGLSASGFEHKNLETVVTDVTGGMTDKDSGLNVTSDSIVMYLLLPVMQQITELWLGVLHLYDSLTPESATGAMLDTLCHLVGIRRLPATKAKGIVTLHGVEDTEIRVGSIISVDPTGRSFLTTQTVTIAADGSVDVEVESEQAMPHKVEVGALSVISGTVSGVSTATNSSEIHGGTDQETDDALRLRREESLSLNGAGTLASIKANLLALPFVQSVLVLEPQDFGGSSLGVAVLIYNKNGVQDDSINDPQIRKVLDDQKPAGLPYDVETRNGVPYPWYWPSEYITQVRIRLKMRLGQTIPDSVKTEVKKKLFSLNAQTGFGRVLFHTEIEDLMTTIAGVERATARFPTPSDVSKDDLADFYDANLPDNDASFHTVWDLSALSETHAIAFVPVFPELGHSNIDAYIQILEWLP